MNNKNNYGLIGYPLGHSYSPKIHDCILKHTKDTGTYKLYEIISEEIPEFLKNMKDKGLGGINVTIPYKQTVIPFMDDISNEALKIGAVNTIKILKDGRLKGYNTDYFGFMQTLKVNNVKINGTNALILGSGGAARTVYACMEDLNVSRIYIASRNPDKVTNFKNADIIKYDEIQNIAKINLAVNCTPVGMYPHPDETPLKEKNLTQIETLVDLIYNPSITQLMKIVKKSGGCVINGLYMLVAQAVAAREIWTETKISRDITLKVYKQIKTELQ